MKLRYRRLDEKVGAIFTDHFKDPGRRPLLLDIGSGRGEFAKFLSEGSVETFGSWNYLGLEPSPEQLKQRDIQNWGMGFLGALAEQVPLPDMIADGILIKEALDHCYDPSKVFREAKRLLRPGGVLVVTVTNDRSYFKKSLPWINRAHKASQTDHLFFFGPQDLESLGKEAGFDRVLAQTYNYLKLPRILEKALGANRPLLDLTDRLGKTLLPGLGGGILFTAVKK